MRRTLSFPPPPPVSLCNKAYILCIFLSFVFAPFHFLSNASPFFFPGYSVSHMRRLVLKTCTNEVKVNNQLYWKDSLALQTAKIRMSCLWSLQPVSFPTFLLIWFEISFSFPEKKILSMWQIYKKETSLPHLHRFAIVQLKKQHKAMETGRDSLLIPLDSQIAFLKRVRHSFITWHAYSLPFYSSVLVVSPIKLQWNFIE